MSWLYWYLFGRTDVSLLFSSIPHLALQGIYRKHLPRKSLQHTRRMSRLQSLLLSAVLPLPPWTPEIPQVPSTVLPPTLSTLTAPPLMSACQRLFLLLNRVVVFLLHMASSRPTWIVHGCIASCNFCSTRTMRLTFFLRTSQCLTNFQHPLHF